MNGNRQAGWLLVALLAAGLVGCVVQEFWTYDKPGVTADQQIRDEAQCGGQAISQTIDFQVFGKYGFDRQSYNDCMYGRGYAVKRQTVRRGT